MELFAQVLRELGYVEGRDIVTELRNAESVIDRIPGLVSELLSIPVDILVPQGTVTTLAAKAATIVRAGGLLSFIGNRPTQYRRLADFVDKIFAGARPADLPMEGLTNFDLVINVTAARKLGLTIPQSVFARAVEVVH